MIFIYMIRKLLLFFILFAACTYFLHDRFSIENISYNDAVGDYPAPNMTQDISTILDQPFTYLGKGHQSYAFISSDGQHVLKFFKFSYLKPAWHNGWLSVSRKQELVKQKKLKRVFAGYNTAYTIDQDNTGVQYVHLNKSSNLNKKIIVQDLFGLSHTVDLDHVYFIIQKKASVTRKVLKELLDKGDLEGFKTRIGQLLDMYISEYKRGLIDGDHNIMSNTGFLPDKAIRIDVGRLNIRPEIQDPQVYMKDLRKVVSKRIDKWLKFNYPREYVTLHNDIELKLKSYEQL